ncbi:MFS transporter [Deinococcus taeanensis]|uniref:MFS transporter n=1 Tax=Deinococcus taeanensis TaxID=2737050 RepID=UPI001CDD06DB|nr:MFS transporter [Deinococcus taeanensis]UBV43197.1 MFS transporter [Deinococcus taeanensis]
MTLRARLPMQPGTLRVVMIALLSLAAAEFVRSGLYLSYLGQSGAVQAQLRLPDAAVGLAWATHIAADTLMRGPAGLLIARQGLRTAMIAGATLSLISVSLLPLAHGPVPLLLIAALHGVGFSVAWPGAMNLTADVTRSDAQGRTLTAVGMLVTPMIGLGYFVFGSLRSAPLQTTYLITLGMLGLSLLAAVLLPARAVRGPARTPLTREGLRRTLRRVRPLLPAALMQTVTLSLFGQVLYKLADALKFPYWQLISVLIVGGAVAFACLPIIGRMADRGRAVFTLTAGYALIAAGMAGLALVPPLWAMYPLAAVVGVGFAGVQPGWAALVTRTLPAAERPTAWGALMTMENTGTAVGPLLGALAFTHLGAGGPFALGATLALITTTFYLLTRHVFAAGQQPEAAS